jgi:hypothetical protein
VCVCGLMFDVTRFVVWSCSLDPGGLFLISADSSDRLSSHINKYLF